MAFLYMDKNMMKIKFNKYDTAEARICSSGVVATLTKQI